MAEKKKIKTEVKEKDDGLEQKVSKEIVERENKQLLSVFLIILAVFALFFIPYFYIQSSKHFEYGKLNWFIEDYNKLKVYHGQFKIFNNQNITYNVFLRNDPRKNMVETSGNFSYFKYGGYVSITPEIDACRSDLSRSLTDLVAFLKRGVSVAKIDVATTDSQVSKDTGRPYINCNSKDRTVIVLQRGNSSSIVQSDENNFCYTITVKDCNDILPLEKFMVKAVSDFKEIYG